MGLQGRITPRQLGAVDRESASVTVSVKGAGFDPLGEQCNPNVLGLELGVPSSTPGISPSCKFSDFFPCVRSLGGKLFNL